MLLGGGSRRPWRPTSYWSGATSAMASAPAMYGVFSRRPENWSDLPVKFKLSERAGYNSNILNTR